jgi:hypothetical protein
VTGDRLAPCKAIRWTAKPFGGLASLLTNSADPTLSFYVPLRKATPDAIDDIECLADDVASALEENPTSASLRKLATTLGEFATYITQNMGHIVNYGERFRVGERISTGFVESAVNRIVDKRLTGVSRCAGRLGALTCCFRPEHAFSTATSTNLSVAATQRSGNQQTTTLPPFCDGLQ